MKNNPVFRSLLVRVLSGVLAFSAVCLADLNPLITLNESGQGTLLFPGLPISPTTGVLQADPGPGGLALALTYNLLGPPALVAGDLILLEPGSGLISDVIRFNPSGTSAGYPASVVSYSDNLDGADALADTGPPSAFYTNSIRMTEVGPEGNNGFLYTPIPGQPGFVNGFSVTYNIVSDVPEPASFALLGGVVGLLGVARYRRKTAA